MKGFRFRILFVDDEPAVRTTLAAVLESQGYEVLAAEDGFAALNILDHSLPNVIISDLRMPKMSGFEFLQIVRSRFPHLPVIVLSGEYLTSTDAPDGVLADVFLRKGDYTPKEFLTTLERVLAQPPVRPPTAARVWVPVSTKGRIVLTCPKCLRSLDHPAAGLRLGANLTTCPSCRKEYQFFIDHEIEAAIRNQGHGPLSRMSQLLKGVFGQGEKNIA